MFSSADFMTQSMGMALSAGPNQRMNLVVRQNVPAPADDIDRLILKSSMSSSLYFFPMMNSFAMSLVNALMTAPKLNVVPAKEEMRSQRLSRFLRMMSCRAAIFALENNGAIAARRDLCASWSVCSSEPDK